MDTEIIITRSRWTPFARKSLFKISCSFVADDVTAVRTFRFLGDSKERIYLCRNKYTRCHLYLEFGIQTNLANIC